MAQYVSLLKFGIQTLNMTDGEKMYLGQAIDKLGTVLWDISLFGNGATISS